MSRQRITPANIANGQIGQYQRAIAAKTTEIARLAACSIMARIATTIILRIISKSTNTPTPRRAVPGIGGIYEISKTILHPHGNGRSSAAISAWIY